MECLGAIDHPVTGGQVRSDLVLRRKRLMIDFNFASVFPDSRFHLFLQGDLVDPPGFLDQDKGANHRLARGPTTALALVQRQEKAMTFHSVDYAIMLGCFGFGEFPGVLGQREHGGQLRGEKARAVLPQHDAFAVARLGRPGPLGFAILHDDLVAVGDAKPLAPGVPNLGTLRFVFLVPMRDDDVGVFRLSKIMLNRGQQ